MAKNGKQSVGEQLKSNLVGQIEKDVESCQKTLGSLKESMKGLQSKGRDLVEKQNKILEPILKERIEHDRKVSEIEKLCIEQEHKYSKAMTKKFVFEKASVNISRDEIEQIQILSKLYQSFGLKYGLGGEKEPKYSEGCLWDACWTCSDACGGCTGCSGICSDSCTGVLADTLNPDSHK